MQSIKKKVYIIKMCFNCSTAGCSIAGIFILQCGFKAKETFIDFYICCEGQKLAWCLSFPYICWNNHYSSAAGQSGSADHLEQ